MRRSCIATALIVVMLMLVSCRSATIEAKCQGCSLLDGSSKLHPEIPGNPENAVLAMKRIYTALAMYREATGHLPTRQQTLRDLIKKPAYGIELSESDFVCVDAKSPEYAASKPMAADPRYFLSWSAKRPDGSKKPDWPRKGERDLWAFSNHYMRGRYVDRGGKYPESEDYGFAIGLFSDGTVVVLRAEDLVAVKRSNISWRRYFPMETGVPKSALPVNQMANQIRDQRRAASAK